MHYRALEERGGAAMSLKLRLNTIENSRKSLARLVRLRGRNEITDSDYRALVYGLSSLLAYWKLETDTAIQKDILEIKTDIETLKGRVGK